MGTPYVLTFHSCGEWGTTSITGGLRFYSDNNTYTPVSYGSVSQTFRLVGHGGNVANYGTYTVKAFAPAGTTHVGAAFFSNGGVLLDEVSIEVDPSPPPAAVTLGSSKLTFTGGEFILLDVGSAVVDPAGTFNLLISGVAPDSTTVTKTGGVTTVSFTKAMAPNVDVAYDLTLPLNPSGTQNITGSLRSFWLPQTGVTGPAGTVGTWGIREYQTGASNLEGAINVAISEAAANVNASSASVFNHSDPQNVSNPATERGNHNNDFPIISNTVGDDS